LNKNFQRLLKNQILNLIKSQHCFNGLGLRHHHPDYEFIPVIFGLYFGFTADIMMTIGVDGV